MGIFDNAKEEYDKGKSNKILENEIIELSGELSKRYKELKESPSYLKAKNEEVQEAVAEFKKYFSERNFDLSKDKDKFKAFAGEIKAELEISKELELILRVYRGNEIITANTLFLEDKQAMKPNFQGMVFEEKIHLFNKYSNEQEAYKMAMRDIKSDLEEVIRKINENYTPVFQYYDEKEDEKYDKIVDLLEKINSNIS